MVRNAVPACEPLIPDIDIAEIAVVTSSILNPIVFAIGEIYLNDSPKSVISIVPAFADCVNRSATRDASFAFSPKPVIASATIVDTCAKSSPLALAEFKTPAIPSIISLALQPALAISVMPSATSLADHAVVSPNSWAFLFNFCNSPPLAPLTACTRDIALSKVELVFITKPPKPIIGAVTVLVRVDPTVSKFLPALCRCPPIVLDILFVMSSASFCAVFKLFRNPFISRSKYPTAEPTSIATLSPLSTNKLILFNFHTARISL